MTSWGPLMHSFRKARRRRKAREAREAQNRLHGRGAVGRTSSRSSFSSDDIGEIVVDVLLALPRGALWIISKILD